MSNESQLIVEIWDMVRDHIPTSKRLGTAISILKLFEEYGFDPDDMRDIVDEDRYLSTAFTDCFDDDEFEDDDYDEDNE